MNVSSSLPVQPAMNAGARHSGRDWLIAATVLALLLVAFVPRFDASSGPMDEGMVLVYPEMVMRGAVPYRDFETFYGPANPWLLAGVAKVFGWNIFIERTVGLLYRIAILVGIFGIVRRWNVAAAAGSMFLAGCLLCCSNLVAYAAMGAVACAVAAIWAMPHHQSRARSGLAGALAGAAILFRVDFGLAVVLASAALLIGRDRERQVSFIGGAAIALLPIVVLAYVAGLQQLADNLFLYPVFHCSAGRRLPIGTAPPEVLNLFALHVVAVVANLVAGSLAIRRAPRETKGRALLALALLGAGVTHQAFQRLDLIHCLYAAFLSIGMLPLSLLVLFSGRRQLRKPALVAVSSTAIISLLVALVARSLVDNMAWSVTAAFSSAQPLATFVSRNGRSFGVPSSEVADNVAEVLATLDISSKPGERLFVGPGDLRRTNYSDTFIYHMVPKLQPATYFLEMNPFSANRPGSRLAADLESADWVVLNQMWDDCEDSNRSCENGSNAPNEVRRARFELVGQYGPYGVFKRRG